jgi:hypothetical protein
LNSSICKGHFTTRLSIGSNGKRGALRILRGLFGRAEGFDDAGRLGKLLDSVRYVVTGWRGNAEYSGP